MKKNWFTIKKVHPQIYAIAEFHHWERVISYLIVDGQDSILIDTGMGYQPISPVLKNLVTKDPIVLLTHCHWDHIGSSGSFPVVYVPDNIFEKQLISDGFSSVNIKELKDESCFDNPFLPKQYLVKGIKKYQNIKMNQLINTKNYTIKAIHTPGHTPGSFCFIIRELNVLFTGDTVYPGPLYAHLPESNVQDYYKSLKNLLKITNNQTILFPGHNSWRSNYSLLQEVSKGFSQILSYSGNVKSNLTYKGSSFSIIAKPW